MKPGSVIVDMAAEMGGNCALTKRDAIYRHETYGVTMIGFTDLVSRMAPQSSDLYANNLWHLVDELGGGSGFQLNMEDEIVDNMMVVTGGAVTWVPIDQRP
jgi:NAD(P) transhydrogenase subunit alpha